ncbi:hypothetical protein JCM10450v2_003441 [Rhodotorula kratochvilovae]
MTPTVQVQPCEVCGKETKQRCSACATAGVDLFFCSKEHQKLVWPVHRDFCSHGSSTFAMPALSAAELADARKRMHDPIRTIDGEAVTLAYDLQRVSGENFEALLRKLAGCLERESAVKHKPLLIAMIRSALFSQPVFDVDNVAEHCEQESHVLLGATFLFHVFRPLQMRGLLPHDPSTVAWYAPLCHRALLLGALEVRAMEHQDPRLVEFYRSSIARQQNWIRSGMGTDNPVIESALSRVTLQTLV